MHEPTTKEEEAACAISGYESGEGGDTDEMKERGTYKARRTCEPCVKNVRPMAIRTGDLNGATD